MREQYALRLEWLVEKHAMLLELMRSHDIEMWIVVSEEFHADPVMPYTSPLRFTTRGGGTSRSSWTRRRRLEALLGLLATDRRL